MTLRTQDAPASSDAFGANDSASVIDRHSDFDGTYSTDRDLRIEGKVKGNLTCQGTLHVAQGATVNAEIEAEQVVVAGVLEGTITCRTRLQIMPSGEVNGKISTPSLVINEGARYEGQMEMPSHTSRLSAGRPRIAPGGGSAPEEPGGHAEQESGTARPAAGGNFIRRFGPQETREQTSSPDDDTSEAASES